MTVKPEVKERVVRLLMAMCEDLVDGEISLERRSAHDIPEDTLFLAERCRDCNGTGEDTLFGDSGYCCTCKGFGVVLFSIEGKGESSE